MVRRDILSHNVDFDLNIAVELLKNKLAITFSFGDVNYCDMLRPWTINSPGTRAKITLWLVPV
jgi:hypothetical protein